MNFILAVAQDPGGAVALVPVLKALAGKDRIQLSILARHQACQVFGEAGLSFQDCDLTGPDEERDWRGFADRWLDRRRPHLVLTATSLGPGPERGFIRAARGAGIPCITLVDSWTNYQARFLDAGEDYLTTDALPDVVAVIDEFAAGEMRRAGFPKDRLAVVGQPDFDHFVDWVRSGAGREQCHRVRADLAVPGDARLVVFFSQPIADMYGPETSPAYRGYDESTVLGLLLSSLARVAIPLCLAVKLHPKESPGQLTNLVAAANLPVRVVTDQEADHLIVAADLVVGMTSMALVRAALAGKPTLSVQPHLRVEDALVLGRMGLLEPVTDPALLTGALEMALAVREGRGREITLPSSWTDNRATERVVALVKSLAGGPRRPWGGRSHRTPSGASDRPSGGGLT